MPGIEIDGHKYQTDVIIAYIKAHTCFNAKILEKAFDELAMYQEQSKEKAADKNEWIPVKACLPPEPCINAAGPEAIKKAIFEGNIEKYIVSIDSQETSSALYYAGGGKWTDLESLSFYDVVAWKPFPVSYKK